MNENRPMQKPKNKKKKYISNDGLFLQALLSICVVLLLIMSFFVKEFKVPLEVILSMLMFTMAYNNQTSYARDNMTLVYTICGFAILIMTLLELAL